MQKYLNAFQSLLTALIVALPAFLIASGCTQDANTFQCDGSWLDPKFVVIILAVIAGAKLVLSFLSGGIKDLFAPKAVISKSGDPGTVPPEAVKK